MKNELEIDCSAGRTRKLVNDGTNFWFGSEDTDRRSGGREAGQGRG